MLQGHKASRPCNFASMRWAAFIDFGMSYLPRCPKPKSSRIQDAKLEQNRMYAMTVVDIQTAAAELTQLVRAIELGKEAEIVIAREGRPVAKLVAVDAAPPAWFA